MSDITAVEKAEAIELEYWRSSPLDNPAANSVENIINKAGEARVFLEKLQRFDREFGTARSILELGSGQGWASCLVKRRYPNNDLTATDLSPTALEGVKIWSQIYRAEPDSTIPCRAYNTPFRDASFDLVFAFAAAHHFRRHRSVLREIARLLRPQGTCLFLHEPSCAGFIHSAAVRRVNRKRPEVPEDVLIRRLIAKAARDAGMDASFRFAPTGTNRASVPAIYYTVLRVLPVLQPLLPCTVDVVLRMRPLRPEMT